jgi:hypothetical protein
VTAEPRVSVEGGVKHLGVAKDSVYRWIEAGSLRAHNLQGLPPGFGHLGMLRDEAASKGVVS